ncbi:hypothetical protein BS47DRAFT_1337019 [Hydnum rufescens UP504]|uniref:Uncharacterized protein n=1 Tax=Hydnum rufescens UP504 TaxID=1448309 RepID=A0A9P6B869_9AGAM|nr:hypothetical protein BS47DRAFT_1337019 [Hydnum rufescens UP504]
MDDDPDEGDPGGPSGPSGPGGPSGRGRGTQGDRGGRRSRGGRGGANRGKKPLPSDRKLRSHNVAPKEIKLRRVNEDVTWERTLSEWRKDAATATRNYGKPAPLTAASLSSLPHIPKPHRVVGPEGEVDLEEIWSS